MKYFSSILLIGVSIAVTACSAPTVPPIEEEESTSSESIIETNNVLYRGTLTEAGITIFMQGTHRLTLDDGRFILLESATVSMDDYLGKRVEVRGSIRPTVEAGGQIMRVQSVTSMDASSQASSSSFTSAESAAADEDGSLSSLSSLSPLISSVASLPAPATSAAPVVSEQPAGTPAQQASSVVPWQASDELTAKALTMSNVNMDMDNWTQEYCSTHWKFCIPIHRNWWFKSFGATASSLWHVEIGPLEMNNLGEGPLVINLLNGTMEAAGSTDGQVTVAGETVVGYRTWEGGRHFEIRGPVMLEQAVRIITGGLRPSES